MPYVVAAVAGFAFGAADQYLGNFSSLGAWAAALSGMSAPWLAVPFIAGMTQDRRERAIALGLVVTMAALLGYFVMTYSPLENVPVARWLPGVGIMIGTNMTWILAGLVTGPLYGYLGHRWRVARSWASAVLITVALCFEPLARSLSGHLTHAPLVWGGEVAVGALAAAAFAFLLVVHRRSETVPPAV